MGGTVVISPNRHTSKQTRKSAVRCCNTQDTVHFELK